MAKVKVKTRAKKKARVKQNRIPLRASMPVKSVSSGSNQAPAGMGTSVPSGILQLA